MSDTPDPVHAALAAYGVMRFMRRVQGGMEDVEGAVAEGQYGAAASMARNVALLCLSIRSLAHGAPLDLDEESVCFDVFDRVPADETAQALLLAREALDIDDDGAAAWLERFAAFVAETEHLLGYGGPLPLLRSPEGAFAMIRVARRWSGVLAQLGWPPLLPERWAVPKAVAAGGGAQD